MADNDTFSLLMARLRSGEDAAAAEDEFEHEAACGVCAGARGRRRSMSSPNWVGHASSATLRGASWITPASSATAHTISRRAKTGR